MVDGAYFIDRDPRFFPYVLNYLRNGQLVTDSDISLEALKYEASYFGLVNLEKELNKRIGLKEDKSEDLGKCLSNEDRKYMVEQFIVNIYRSPDEG